MDINMTSNVAQTQGASDSVGMLMLRKAISIEAQNALSLIAAIQPVQNSSNLPAHLGQNINTTA